MRAERLFRQLSRGPSTRLAPNWITTRSTEEALALRTERQGAGHPALAECYELLGRAAVLSGAYQAAEASLRQAVAIRRNLGDGAHPLLSNSLREFGALLHHLGRLEEARQAYQV